MALEKTNKDKQHWSLSFCWILFILEGGEKKLIFTDRKELNKSIFDSLSFWSGENTSRMVEL